jgi:DNA polymerase-3 subunit epsilon
MVDTSARGKHGALIDAKILAEVYLELMGGRQSSFALGVLRQESATIASIGVVRLRPRPLTPRLTPEDEEAHNAFLVSLGENPLWLRYRPMQQAMAN